MVKIITTSVKTRKPTWCFTLWRRLEAPQPTSQDCFFFKKIRIFHNRFDKSLIYTNNNYNNFQNFLTSINRWNSILKSKKLKKIQKNIKNRVNDGILEKKNCQIPFEYGPRASLCNFEKLSFLERLNPSFLSKFMVIWSFFVQKILKP